jgi:hypothetical protein
VKTRHIFICRECGLPIRNKPEGDKRVNRVCFTCAQCEVCEKVSQDDMDTLQKRLHGLISTVVEGLYHYHHGKQKPPERFKQAVREKLEKQSNLAEARINEIKEAIGKIKEPVENAKLKDDLLRQITASEKVLTGFSYLSPSRMALSNSPTLLRHWVALGRKLHSIAEQNHDPEFVLGQLKSTRYELNLVRLSKLTGDNPVCITRDLEHYKGWKESKLCGPKRLKELRRQTETKALDPPITDTLESILRFVGNACFVTEYDEVIEFRAQENNYLVKYLIKDEMLIVIDDLWFLKDKAADQHENTPLAELRTVYPKRRAAERVMRELDEGLYLPNCVDLQELSNFCREVEKETLRASQI